VFDKSVPVSGNGSYTSPSLTPTQAGTYWWTANYSGDAANNTAASGCGAESVTIGKAAPGIATAPSAGGQAGSAAVTDTATLSGGYSPGGSIEFQLYGPSAAANCSGTAVFDKTVPVSGNGSYTSPSFTPTQAGTYWWTASYGGDTNNKTATSGCGTESVTITPAMASPSLTTTPGSGGPVGSTTVKDTATLLGGSAPTGSIIFNLYGPSAQANCTGTAVDTETVTVSGNGSYATPNGFAPVKAGTYWWTASYTGDSGNNPAASGCGAESVTISQFSPGLATVPSTSGTGMAGSTTVKDTATVSGGFNPTGTITFNLYGPSASANCTTAAVDTETATVSGNGSYTTPAGFAPSQAGTYWWTASYGGDTNNNAAASGCGAESVTVSPPVASPSLASFSSPGGPIGSTTVTDKATLSGGTAPTGTITFKLYGPSATANCATTPVFNQMVTVSGNGNYVSPAFTPSQAGTYYWTASYSGDTGNNPAVTGCASDPVTIGQLSPGMLTIPSTTGSGMAGSTTVKDTATMSGGFSPTGTITFSLYGPSAQPNCTGTAVDTETATVNGNGSYTTPAGFAPSQAGTYWWTASYGGDANNTTAASGCGAESVTLGLPGPQVYWADNSLGTIMAVPAAGGPPAQLAGGQNGPGYLAVDNGFVYWADSGAGTIMKVPATGGTPTVLAGGQNGPGYVAVENGFVYWADTGAGTIMAVPVTGGPLVTLASGQPGPGYVAVDNGVVYWADSGLGAIMAVPAAGGPPAELVGGQSGPVGVVASGGFVYWANTGTGMIMSVRAAGGPPLVLASGLLGPASLAVDSSFVYWADSVGGTIWRVPATGGAAAELASGQNGPASLAVSSGTLYWVDKGAGTIMKVAATGGTPVVLASGPGPAYLAVAGPASPALTTASSPGGPVGSTTVTDTATLSGGSAPTGTIDFQLWGPSATAICSGTPVFDKTVIVGGNGSYTSPSFTPSQAGTYWWTASYSGDGANNAAASGCGGDSVTIGQLSTGIATTPSTTGTGTAGSTTVTDSATLSGGLSPTGTITFSLYGPSSQPNCNGTAVDTETATASGDGSYTTPTGATPSQAGTYWWIASYGGDTNNTSAASKCGDESVTLTAPVLYVATDGSDTTGTGSQAKPLQTITAALALAQTSGGATIDVAGGSYTEGSGGSGLNLISNVTINGGFSEATWTQLPGNTTTIVGSPQAVLANSVTGITLADLTLAPVTPAGPTASVYGIRAINGSSLALSNITIATPNATAGTAGATGANGANGLRSTNPNGGNAIAQTCSTATVGGSGGSGGGNGNNGGNGGGASGCGNGQPGTPGGPTVPPGGANGNGGFSGTNSGGNGGPGNDGTAGSSGSAGAGASFTTAQAGPSWTGASGANGTPGQDGGGGGGGGAGGGICTIFCVTSANGGGGGGGGGGGAGGGSGGGGQAGGGSFGIYLWHSTVLVAATSIQTGNGGPGGSGALGGTGGSGAAGGSGGAGINGSGDGGPGGKGGNGGGGGLGGGGSGGPSVGIFRSAGSTYVDQGGNTIAVGTGGAGGGSPDNSHNGAPGIAANLV
jgi:hypothetical protein